MPTGVLLASGVFTQREPGSLRLGGVRPGWPGPFASGGGFGSCPPGDICAWGRLGRATQGDFASGEGSGCRNRPFLRSARAFRAWRGHWMGQPATINIHFNGRDVC